MNIQQRYLKFLQQSLCSQAHSIFETMEKYQKLSPRVTGTIGEILLKQVIEPYKVGYGEVVSKAKETSGECDLMVYKQPVLLQIGHVTVVPRRNAKVIIQVQTNLSALNDLEKMKTNCKKQIKFADILIFVVYGWWLKENRIKEFKEEIQSLGGNLFILSQGFAKMYSNELYNLIREMQSVLT